MVSAGLSVVIRHRHILQRCAVLEQAEPEAAELARGNERIRHTPSALAGHHGHLAQ